MKPPEQWLWDKSMASMGGGGEEEEEEKKSKKKKSIQMTKFVLCCNSQYYRFVFRWSQVHLATKRPDSLTGVLCDFTEAPHKHMLSCKHI